MFIFIMPVILAGFFMIYFCKKKFTSAALFAVSSNGAFNADEYDDIKIADEKFGKTGYSDTSEMAAKDFLREKEIGNIEKAHSLGKNLAKNLLRLAQELIMDDTSMITQQEIHHRLLLCSYIANHVIAGASPNSIVAQTALARFYSEIEERSNVLHRHVSDTAAFSLYILNERSRNDITEIGKIYAKFVGKENNIDKINDGNQIYSRFYKEYTDIVSSAGFSA